MIKILFLALITFYFAACGSNVKDLPVKKIITDKPPTLQLKHKRELDMFQLYVQTPNGTRIRILNIKPKYKDGIWLKRGKYHIEVSAKKHITHKEWINLQKDTNLTIALKQKKEISMGFIHWRETDGLKYIDGIFWQDQSINKQKKMDWNNADKYCKNLQITINKHILIDDFELPNEKELLKLRKFNTRLDYSGAIYWSSSTDKEHKQFAKYIYINKDKSGWYNKSGKTYVRCISRKHYPLNLPLMQLVKHFIKQEHYSYLDAYEFAVDLKYGKPVIKHVVKAKNHTVKLTLRSQKYDSEKNYFYYKNHTVKEKRDITVNPDIKFEIINNKLVFRGIN